MKKKKEKINMLSAQVIDFRKNEDDSRWKYLEKLNDAINNDNGYNIAISGSYGTGKSSIVKTYIDNYKLKKRGITISIGSFLKTNPVSDGKIKKQSSYNTADVKHSKIILENNEKNDAIILSSEQINKLPNSEDDQSLSIQEEDLMEKIEKSIVKQLIYRIKYSNSKLSGIPRVQRWWKSKYFLFSIMIVYVAFWLILLNNNSILNNLFYKYPFFNINSFFSYDVYCFMGKILYILFVIDIFILIICFIYNIFISINKSKSKIKIREYELEIDQTRESSKYSFLDNLYEILYAFMNSPIEVVFFEDIDRYQKDVCIKVVEDLKELNQIINTCYGMRKRNFHKNNIKKKKKIVFVYSFRDSIFYDAKEKNKFYDYIVSIMPISTYFNSDIHFIEELGNERKYISKELISRVSFYITDMRTIKNTINDYNLFSSLLKEETLNSKTKSQLFALCAYKNYDMEAYDSLIGINNTIDALIDEFIKKIREKLDNDINTNNNDLKQITNNIAAIKNELINNNKSNDEYPNDIFVNDDKIRIADFLKEDFDINLLKSKEVRIGENSIVKNIDDYVGKIENEQKRKTYLLKDLESLSKLNEIDEESYAVNDDIFIYSKDNLYDDLIKNYSNNVDEKNEECFIKELIYLGFIRSNYINYISSPINSSYFTINDSRFLFCYKQRTYYFTGSVDNPYNILDYLGETACNSSFILNNDILKYIYDNKNDVNIYKDNLLKMLSDINIDKLNYLYQLSKNNYKLYIKVINDLSYSFDVIWKTYLDTLKNNNFNSIIIDIALINKINVDEIVDLKELREIISKDSTKDNIRALPNDKFDERRIDTIFNNLVKLNVEFYDITKLLDTKNNKDIIRTIVNNNLYKITKKNIRTVLFEDDIQIDYPNNFNQIIYSDYGQYIVEHIKNNLDDFSNEFYMGDNNIKFVIQDENMIKYILKNTNNDLFIDSIIRRETFKIDGVMIDYKYLKLAYNNNHINMNWAVINKYATGDKEHDNVLLTIALDDILKWYKYDNKYINIINHEFMKCLIDGLYKRKYFVVLDYIFKRINVSEFDKYNITNKIDSNELSHKIKWDLVNYNKNFITIIATKCDDATKNNFIINFAKNGDFDKIKKIITKEELLLIKDFIVPNEIIYVINKLFIAKTIHKNDLISYLKKCFATDENFSIKYRKEYLINIFSNISKNRIKYNYSSKNINFIIKR